MTTINTDIPVTVSRYGKEDISGFHVATESDRVIIVIPETAKERHIAINPSKRYGSVKRIDVIEDQFFVVGLRAILEDSIERHNTKIDAVKPIPNNVIDFPELI